MIKRFLILVTLGFLIYSFIPFVRDVVFQDKLNDLSKTYVNDSSKKLETANIVTSIIVTFRGLDTLGEVTVLFIATAGVGFLLKRKKSNPKEEPKRDASEVLKTGASFLVPLTIMFGAYIFIHGHLTPGGGFQGGVIIASAFLLLLLSNVKYQFNHFLLHFVESISGVAYVIIGVAGLILAGSFLDPSFLPMGRVGALLSAGAIPLIYSFIGLKVGSELSSVLDSMSSPAEDLSGGEE